MVIVQDDRVDDSIVDSQEKFSDRFKRTQAHSEICTIELFGCKAQLHSHHKGLLRFLTTLDLLIRDLAAIQLFEKLL